MTTYGLKKDRLRTYECKKMCNNKNKKKIESTVVRTKENKRVRTYKSTKLGKHMKM